jgi:alpha-amylase/alpha-mannosidase (GH57 family)
MWLPETAVDYESLEYLAEQGIKFTILAPHQAKRFREIGAAKWIETKNGIIDSQIPYLCKLPSGAAIKLFFYDGFLSQNIAFGDILKSGERFSQALLHSFPKELENNRLAHIATDGETYGHHHQFGDMALAYCIRSIEQKKDARMTIYGEFLQKNPPMYEVDIQELTSWSCAHGVERWRSNCGCYISPKKDNKQQWRGPLRDALNEIRDAIAPFYEKEMKQYTKDSWEIRDHYIEVLLDDSPENVQRFVKEYTLNSNLNEMHLVKLFKLLELQKYAMYMYTSCGWFFDDISGTEAIQIMQYAARAIQLFRELEGINLESKFLDILKKAESNSVVFKNGADVYKRQVTPAMVIV